MARIFIITNPMPAANKSVEVTTSKLIRVIMHLADSISVFGGNVTLENDLPEIAIKSYPYIRQGNKLKRIFAYLKVQFGTAYQVIKNIKSSDKCIFWLADKMIIPYLAAKLKGAEINYFVYGNETNAGVKGISISLIRFMANHATYLCAESPAVIRHWAGLISNHKTKILHLYVDEIQFNNFSERENVIGIAARIAKEKHIKQCITAFCEIHKANPSWRLEIAGTGIQEAECRELIKSLQADGYIQMLGWIPHGEISRITTHWKYYLLASDYEGVPNGLIEMMGQGIPAIVTPVGGVPDIVEDGVNGWLLKGTDAAEIESAVEAAIKSDGYDTMARRAYETIAEEFSLRNAQKQAEKTLGRI